MDLQSSWPPTLLIRFLSHSSSPGLNVVEYSEKMISKVLTTSRAYSESRESGVSVRGRLRRMSHKASAPSEAGDAVFCGTFFSSGRPRVSFFNASCRGTNMAAGMKASLLGGKTRLQLGGWAL